MRFFSNDAKENADPTDENDTEYTDQVKSDPVAVPQQRAGSPWSNAPGSSDTAVQSTDSSDFSDSADGELTEQERRDGTEEGLRVDDSEVRHDGDDLVPDPDAPATEAHTKAPAEDQAVDLPVDERHDITDTGESTTTTYGPNGVVGTTAEPADEPAAVENAEPAAVADAMLKDEDELESPTVVQPATGEPLDSADSTEAESDASPVATDTVYGQDVAEAAPAVVEEEEAVVEEAVPASAIQMDAVDLTPAEEVATDADAAPVVAAVPVAAAGTPTGDKPGSVPAPGVDRLFADGDSFAGRFREIQLRFVDSPKDATTEAAALVNEAIDKLTSALQAQRDGLSADSDDTEQLRVALRGYREVLNRLTAL